MKRAIAIATLTWTLTGCLTLSNAEKQPDVICAKGGLYYQGFDVTGHVDGKEVGNVKCGTPETPKQKCMLKAADVTASEGQRLDSKWGTKRVLVGVGYLFWIVPGALMYYNWSDENRADYANYVMKSREAHEKCDALDTAH